MKVQNKFHVLNNIICSTDCKYRTAATLYTSKSVCFMFTIVNSLHKGDNKDNNDNNNLHLMWCEPIRFSVINVTTYIQIFLGKERTKKVLPNF